MPVSFCWLSSRHLLPAATLHLTTSTSSSIVCAGLGGGGVKGNKLSSNHGLGKKGHIIRCQRVAKGELHDRGMTRATSTKTYQAMFCPFYVVDANLFLLGGRLGRLLLHVILGLGMTTHKREDELRFDYRGA